MNKIIKLALGLSYPQDKLVALEEIIAATPNPTMATEILLGVYEKPQLDRKVKDKNGVVRILKEANYWTETVEYTFLKNKRISAYFQAGTTVEKLNDRNWESLKCSGSEEGAKYLTFTSAEKEESTGNCNFAEWLSCENVGPTRDLDYSI